MQLNDLFTKTSKSRKIDLAELQLGRKLVVTAERKTNVCFSHFMLLNQRLKSLLVVGQTAVETQALLSLRQPLQQDVNGGVKLLRLRQSLLQARLLGHRQVAHGLPAGAQLLHLHLHPRGVVVAALGQLPRRALQGLDAHRSLAQLLLEDLRPSGKQRRLRMSDHGLS